MSKSQVQQNTSEKESSWSEKKGTYETVFLLISSTHQIANIILDDGHFARESEKAGGRWRRGSCSLLYCGHRGKLQSSVTHLEYLTHCERHYFSLISRVFFVAFDGCGHFERSYMGQQFKEWNRSEGCALLRVMTMQVKARSCFMKRESEKRWLIMCVCRGTMRGDHNIKTQIWLCVWTRPYGSCALGLNSISRSFYLKSQNIKRQFLNVLSME